MIWRRVARVAFYVLLALMGSIAAWRTAPDAEGWLLPVLTDVYLVPFDPARSPDLFSRQLDRICWRQHVRKTRDAEAFRWLITIVGKDGIRYFTQPVNAETGEGYSNRNSRAANTEGKFAYCAILPDGFDATEGFRVDNYLQYLPKHGLWVIEQDYLTFDVPAVLGDLQ